MFLEIATTIGALIGAGIATHVSTSTIGIIFGIVLVYSAWLSHRPRAKHTAVDSAERLAVWLEMDSTYPSLREGLRAYHVHRIPLGFGLMLVAGTMSGLLGIGSGALKVLAMDEVMRVPFKVSTTTSSFMIGVTAAASAGVYLNRGYIDPALAMPVMLGVLLGSTLGTRVLVRTRADRLRYLFAFVMLFLAATMIYNALTGRI